MTGLYTGLSLNMTQAVDTVIISDPGQDQDDEMAMVLLRALTERELVSRWGGVGRGACALAQPLILGGGASWLSGRG